MAKKRKYPRKGGRKFGVNKGYVRWTQAQVLTLVEHWYERSSRTLHAMLKPHTWLAIKVKARNLGLRMGVPQGHVSIAEAARRSGFDYDALRTLLHRAGVTLTPRYGARVQTAARAPRLHVEWDEVAHVVESELASESLSDAAKRFGVHRTTLYPRALAEGYFGGGKGNRVRLPPETWDAIVAKHPLKIRWKCEHAPIETVEDQMRKAA